MASLEPIKVNVEVNVTTHPLRSVISVTPDACDNEPISTDWLGTLHASDDQQAVTVRFSYPAPSMFRGSIIGEGHPYANGGWMKATDGESFEWRSGFAMMGSDGVRIHGETPNSWENPDTASGFVTGSCPDTATLLRNSGSLLRHSTPELAAEFDRQISAWLNRREAEGK